MKCSLCKEENEIYYKCKVCIDYYLCEKCIEKMHPNHFFVRKTPEYHYNKQKKT